MALKKFRLRAATSEEWAAFNPILAPNEPALDTTLGIMKIGNGTDTWTSLPVWAAAIPAEDIEPGTIDWTQIDNVPDEFPPAVHAHVSSEISDLVEVVQDLVASELVGSGVTLTYDDTAGTVTITNAGTTDLEAVRDAIGVALIGTGVISVAVNDGANTITISSTATANDTDANLKARANHTGTQTLSTISDFAAEIRKTDADIFYSGGAYPLRNTVTTDAARRVRWVGPVAPTIGSGYATASFDVWEKS